MPRALVSALLVLAGCSSLKPPPPPPPHDARLQRTLETLRGAKFTRPVPVHHHAAHRFKVQLRERLRPALRKEVVRRDLALLSAIGLLPARFDIRAAMLAGIDATRAYYDHQSGEVHMRRSSRSEEVVLLHELAHALQNQRFDLRAITRLHQRPTFDRRDEAMALALLSEGEATYLSTRFRLERSGLGTEVEAELARRAKRARSRVVTGPRLPYHFFSDPYLQAPLWVVAHLKRGGWAAVDALFQRRPLTSEQVLHPERHDDAPVRLSLPDLSRKLGKGWTLVAEDTLGEWYLRVLFRQLSGRIQAPACAGWDGDRLQVYRSGKRSALVWFTTWDSERDAREFAEALRLARAGAEGTPLAKASVTREGQDVLVIGGVDKPLRYPLYSAARTGVKRQ